MSDCFFPPTDADLHLLIIAEGTAHDPAPGPTRHVCFARLRHSRQNLSTNSDNYEAFSYAPANQCFVLFFQVTTEQQEKLMINSSLPFECLSFFPLCFDWIWCLWWEFCISCFGGKMGSSRRHWLSFPLILFSLELKFEVIIRFSLYS